MDFVHRPYYKEHNVLETGRSHPQMTGVGDTLLGQLERPNLSHWETYNTWIWFVSCFLHLLSTSFSVLVLDLYIHCQHFYCTFSCYLSLTDTNLRCLCGCMTLTYTVQWLTLALSNGPSWVGVSHPYTWRWKQIQFPTVFCSVFFWCIGQWAKSKT
jgi:hypothetical protein